MAIDEFKKKKKTGCYKHDYRGHNDVFKRGHLLHLWSSGTTRRNWITKSAQSEVHSLSLCLLFCRVDRPLTLSEKKKKNTSITIYSLMIAQFTH